MWILIYWIICGLIVFSLVEPTVYILTFPLKALGEFLLCLLFGGIIIPILVLIVIIDIFSILFGDDND